MERRKAIAKSIRAIRVAVEITPLRGRAVAVSRDGQKVSV